MVGVVSQKRKRDFAAREKAPRPKKKVRKQTDYHSSDSEASDGDAGFTPLNLNDSDEEESALTGANSLTLGDGSSDGGSTNADSSGGSEGDEQSVGEDAITKRVKKTSKRNDPEAFSTSISKILSTKLSQSLRKDPVLSRSREAVETSNEIANERLEKKVRAQLRADRKDDLDRGRVKDVLGLSTGEAGETAEEEKKLRKIAQRGVIKLFNAVRAAQVKGEEAAREERKKGTVGAASREELKTSASKQGFLDLINGKSKVRQIEEA